jgi:hypothetical protein
MRGKRAKLLRKAAASVCQNILKVKLSDGYNVYNQARNMRGWVPMTDADGFPMKDPDGTPLKKLVDDLPGTITSAWKFRTMYKNLKAQYKKRFRG